MGQQEGSDSQPEWFEGQQEGSEGQLEWSEGQLEWLEGQPKWSEKKPEGSVGQMGREDDGQTDGRINRLNFSHLQDLVPYLGRCPKRERER